MRTLLSAVVTSAGLAAAAGLAFSPATAFA